MKKLLWLDDRRNPFLNSIGVSRQGERDYEVHWVRDYHEFMQWLSTFGLPDAISFDHDLAEEHYTPEYFWDNYEESKKFQKWKSQFYTEGTGLDCAEYLIDYCKCSKTNLPVVFIHSANPVGADKIAKVINNFIKIK